MRSIKKIKAFMWITMILMGVMMMSSVAFAGCPNGIKGNGTSGIYIDINSAPYTTFQQSDAYLGQYAYGPEGCAWFASARANQITGKGNLIISGYGWWYTHYDFFGHGWGYEPREKSLACYTNHVSVVEAVNGDTITVSEGGMSGTSSQEYGHCVISTMSRSKLESNRGTGDFLGYVYLTDGDQQPIGNVDICIGGKNSITIKGWAYDPDEQAAALNMHIYVDGIFVTSCFADASRPDVHNMYGCGTNHGFEKTFHYPVSSSGSHLVQIYALNTNVNGVNPMLGSGTVTVNSDFATKTVNLKLEVTADNAVIRSGPANTYVVNEHIPKGSKLTAYGYCVNEHGNTWYLTDTGFIYSERVKITQVSGSAQIVGAVMPTGTLRRGNIFVIKGTVTAGNNSGAILKATVTNSAGNVVLEKTETLGSSYSIQGSGIDKAMTYNTLASGDYTMLLVAEETIDTGVSCHKVKTELCRTAFRIE